MKQAVLLVFAGLVASVVVAAFVVVVFIVGPDIEANAQQSFAQDRQLQISREASGQCLHLAVFTRCEGSDSLTDERYCPTEARERVTIERCTPEGWLRVPHVERVTEQVEKR